MTTAMPELWGRRTLPMLTVVPYALLMILAAVTVVEKRGTGGSLLIDLALCATAAAWMLWMITLHPAWRERTGLMAVFLAGLVAIMAILVVRDPWFGFFSAAGYFYAFRLLPWPWEMAGIAAVAVVAGTAQSTGIDRTTALGLVFYLAVVGANVLPMCLLSWLGWNNDKHVQEIKDANRRLETALAENAGLHEQVLAQARAAGVRDERQRMAREIHDTLAQGLTGIIAQLRAAEDAGDDPAAWRRHFTAATGLARESLSEARRSVDALRPEPLETARLAEALADVAARWSARQGIPVQVTTTGAVRPMPPQAEVALLRTAQEALANVAKHARANRVGVTLSYLDGEVALDVRDDGAGFVARSGRGFGLVAMRQRIEDLSGTLQVESEPGLGTGISACIPAEAHA
jgi:signal transduction histidine kinase